MKSNLKNIVDTIGIVAVVGSLLMVFWEIRQNNELMAAEERYNRLSALARVQEPYVANSDISNIFAKDLEGKELSLGERIALGINLDMAARSREWTFNELDFENLPIIYWKRLYSAKPVREHFQRTKLEYDQDFVEFVEQVILADL